MSVWDEPLPDSALFSKDKRTWVYQLQDVDPRAMSESPADFKVVDWQQPDLPLIRANSSSKILAYISIGEAEDYRPYWNPRWGKMGNTTPVWLDRENPEWKGNYKVKFWNETWQAIVYNQLDEIISKGFDGIYMDIIDAYEYWEGKGVDTAASSMIRFVKDIGTYMRGRGKKMLVIPQNGDGLLTSAEYLKAIDGIAIEDLFYGEDEDEKMTNPQTTKWRLNNLRILQDAFPKKPILCVEYLQNPKLMKAATTALRREGFIPYFADRPLNTLRSTVK